MTRKQLDNFFDVLLGFLVIVSGIIILIGGVIFLLHHGLENPDYEIFHGVPRDLKGIEGVWLLLQQGYSEGIIQFGIFLLITIPFIRVVFFVLFYVIQKEYFYVLASLLTLLILTYSLFG